jgi:maleylacetoacetate isomerase
LIIHSPLQHHLTKNTNLPLSHLIVQHRLFAVMAFNSKPAQPAYQLYSCAYSSCAARIVIAAQVLGITLEIFPVDLTTGEHNSDSFRLINPSLAVPVLVIREPDGQETTITQSIAILEYLDELHSTAISSLLPPVNRPKDRAKVRELVNILASDIFPMINGRIAMKVRGIRGELSDQMQWVHDIMSAGFSSYEVLLSTCAGRYSFGDAVTMADVVLVPAYDMATKYKFDIAPYPRIKSVYEEITKLDPFKKENWAV